MIPQRDKFLASNTYAFADTELVEGTKRQEEKRDYLAGVWKEDKQKAHDIYVSEFKPHVPSMTQEEINNSKMPDWEAKPCDHVWDTNGSRLICTNCGILDG